MTIIRWDLAEADINDTGATLIYEDVNDILLETGSNITMQQLKKL